MSRKFTFPIKKQNSCVENSTKTDVVKGGRKIALQKQFSIDIPNSHRSNDKLQNLNNSSSVLSDCTDNNFKSLSIFGIKNQTDRSATAKFEIKSRDRQKCITYRRDERINLNIFLNHTIKTNSDLVESESEKETNIPHLKADTIQYNENTGSYTESTDARQSQLQVKPVLTTNKTIRRPLIRARSAPVRSTEEITKAFQTKRKGKQKKTNKGYLESKGDNFFENDELIGDSERKPKCQNKQLNVPSRVRSTFGGCDVITLVSLFSSSESESEVEEYVSPRKTDCITVTQPQMLRRCGKSVSFQENDLKVISTTTPEFPPINTESMENSITKPTPVQKKKSEEDVIEDYPEHCDTQKEKDCWKLFKKMLGNGVTVNYDTILRGMLTPTELRTQMGKRVELSQENEQNENLP
ncbi:hypothetical protein Bhyg_14981, partial [Pseudolycoriella hygida]